MCKSTKNPKKYLGNIFVLVALGFVFLVFQLHRSVSHSKIYAGIIGWVWFYTVFALFLCSFIRCSLSEPGQVPPYWGFQMGDSESKRKRYCLMCHVFKPDRCHHCSICSRCVLNMDHHCRNLSTAWINNCIGFYNRKFFILRLIYSLLSGYTVLYSLLPALISALDILFKSHSLSSSSFLFLLSSLLLILVLITLSKFTVFHLQLLLKNSTTIESLENSYNGKYSLSVSKNLSQVFGNFYILWAFPVFLKPGKPLGDGINWPIVGQLSLSSEVNIESDGNGKDPKTKNAEIGERLIEESKTPVDSETDTSLIRNNPSVSN